MTVDAINGQDFAVVRAMVQTDRDVLDAADFSLGEAPAGALPVNLKGHTGAFCRPVIEVSG